MILFIRSHNKAKAKNYYQVNKEKSKPDCESITEIFREDEKTKKEIMLITDKKNDRRKRKTRQEHMRIYYYKIKDLLNYLNFWILKGYKNVESKHKKSIKNTFRYGKRAQILSSKAIENSGG